MYLEFRKIVLLLIVSILTCTFVFKANAQVTELKWESNMALAPDESMYAIGSNYAIGNISNAYIWDATTHQLIYHFPNLSTYFYFTSDTHYLILRDSQKIIIFDLRTCQVHKTIEMKLTPPSPNPAMNASQDNRFFLTAKHGDGTARMWNIETGEQVQLYGPLPEREIYSAAFYNDTNMIVTGSTQGRYQFWDRSTGRLLEDREMEIFRTATSPQIPTYTILSNSGKYIAALFHYPHSLLPDTLALEDTTKGKTIYGLSGNYDHVYIHFDEKMEEIVFNKQGTLEIWDINQKKTIKDYRYLSSHRNDLNYSSQKLLVAIERNYTENDDLIKLIDMTDDSVISESRAFADQAVHHPAFSPTEPLLAQGIYKSLAFYSQPAMQFIRSVSHESDKIAFSTGGETLVSAGPDGSLTLFDARTGEFLRNLPSLGPAQALKAGPQAASVITAYATRAPEFWRTDFTMRSTTLVGHTGAVLGVDIAPDGAVFTGGDDKVLKQWNPNTGAWLRDVFTAPEPIRSIAHPFAEPVLLLGLANNTAVLYNRETGQLSGAFAGNSDQAAISNDGKWVLVGTHLWNRAENKLIQIFEGHTGPITSVQFSHDAQSFVTHGADKTNRVWDLREYIGSGVENWGEEKN